MLRLNDSVFENREDEIRRLLYEIRAKGGLPPSRVNRFLKQLDSAV
jgi:hypothetical protein